MIRDPKNLLPGSTARWTEEILANLPDGELHFYNGVADYQGSAAIIVRYDDGNWGHYEWSYGSCSGCDGWEDPWSDSTWKGRTEETIAKEHQGVIDEWRAGAAPVDPETFADYLIGCYEKKAGWIFGDYAFPDRHEELAKMMRDVHP